MYIDDIKGMKRKYYICIDEFSRYWGKGCSIKVALKTGKQAVRFFGNRGCKWFGEKRNLTLSTKEITKDLYEYLFGVELGTKRKTTHLTVREEKELDKHKKLWKEKYNINNIRW